MKTFDIIVVGAGPSGSISSYYLSKKGFKVALIDKKDLTKDKICGGGISRFVTNELPMTLPSNVIEREIKGMSFITPNNEIFKKKEPETLGATVYRSIFDSFLIESSIDVNTTFIPNTLVKQIDKEQDFYIINGKYRAKYLIGADGANSFVKKRFNLGIKQNTKYIGMRAFAKVDQIEDYVSDPECIDFYFKSGFRGYGWVFPLKAELNIGVGIFGKGVLNRDIFKDFVLKSFKLPKEIIKSVKIEGYPIPTYKLPKNFSTDKVFLTGDAAGLVDPVSGEGIHYAIRSGKIVADVIIKDYNNILSEKPEYLYNSYLEKDIIPDLVVSYKLRNFLDKFFLKNMALGFALIKRNPFIFNFLKDYSNECGYYNIYKDCLKNLPKIVSNTLKGDNYIPGFNVSFK